MFSYTLLPLLFSFLVLCTFAVPVSPTTQTTHDVHKTNPILAHLGKVLNVTKPTPTHTGRVINTTNPKTGHVMNRMNPHSTPRHTETFKNQTSGEQFLLFLQGLFKTNNRKELIIFYLVPISIYILLIPSCCIYCCCTGCSCGK